MGLARLTDQGFVRHIFIGFIEILITLLSIYRKNTILFQVKKSVAAQIV